MAPYFGATPSMTEIAPADDADTLASNDGENASPVIVEAPSADNPQQRHLMRVFASDTGPEPLKRCLEWARSKSVQLDSVPVPFIIVAEEGGPHGRAYVAATYEQLLRRSKQYGNTHDTGRHMYEVAAEGPCKMYCDLEQKFKTHEEMEAVTDALNRSAVAFTDAILAHVFDKYGVRMHPVVLSSHGALKWSWHVIFSNAMWASNVHCLAVLTDVIRQTIDENPLVKDYFDTGVYDSNRCFRMYRSTKIDAPERSLVLATGENMAPMPLDESIWRNSLITCFPMQTGGETFYATSLFMRQCGEMIWPVGNPSQNLVPPPLAHDNVKRLGQHAILKEVSELLGHPLASGGVPRNDNPASMADAARKARYADNNIVPHSYRTVGVRATIETITPEQQHVLDSVVGPVFLAFFSRYEANLVYYHRIPAPLLKIRCKSRFCEANGGEHSGNKIYINVDFLHARWRQHCYSTHCRFPQWRPFNDKHMIDLCAQLHAVWPLANPVAGLSAMMARTSLAYVANNEN